METPRVDRILEDWAAVASQARRPAAPPRRVVVRSGLSSGTLAGATLLVVALLAAAVWFGGPGLDGGVGSIPSAPPSATATPHPTPTPTPTPTAVPTIGPCDPADLAARILMWEGAAGHRIAHVDLVNNGSVGCTVDAMAKPELVDGSGSILIEGSNPPPSDVLTIAPGKPVTALVQDGNYCGQTPEAPVSVAFVFGDGRRVVASPVSPTDATVPPCLGAAGSPGTIEMQPWTS
jgi:hypothetical protein